MCRLAHHEPAPLASLSSPSQTCPSLSPPDPHRDPPLKLVITSATLDSKKFAAYYDDCPVFEVPGRAFPVEVVHSLDDHSTDYLEAAVDTALDIHCNQPEGGARMGGDARPARSSCGGEEPACCGSHAQVFAMGSPLLLPFPPFHVQATSWSS